MNEEEFDSLIRSRSFGTEDVAHWEAEFRASTGLATTLGVALWGKTSEEAQRQLLASHPEIPGVVGLADLRKLLQWSVKMSSAVPALQQMRGVLPSILASRTVFIGSRGLTLWEARCEIVRRAIEYLEKR